MQAAVAQQRFAAEVDSYEALRERRAKFEQERDAEIWKRIKARQAAVIS